jgi:hypothetical protein
MRCRFKENEWRNADGMLLAADGGRGRPDEAGACACGSWFQPLVEAYVAEKLPWTVTDAPHGFAAVPEEGVSGADRGV